MKGKGIFAFCSPIVDSFAFVEDSFLENKKFKKGDNLLMSLEDALALAAELTYDKHVCGGSSLNVSRAIGFLGYPITVIGQYSDDDRAEVVKEAVKKCNVTNRFITKPGKPTTQVVIMVTSDASRTMCTVNGVSNDPYVEKVEPSIIDDYDVVLTDGFQLFSPATFQIVSDCVERARKAGKKTALVLASVFAMPGYKESIMKVLENITILSGTIDEFMQLFGKSTKEEVLAHVEKSHFELCAVTMDSRGSYIVKDGKSHYYPAPDVPNIIDTTGAGDCYAAGLIYGYLNGYSIDTIAAISNAVAGYTIARVGISFEEELRQVVSKVLPK